MNIICWMCDDNFPYHAYTGTKYLDQDGNKPCFQCLLESGTFDEQQETEDQNE